MSDFDENVEEVQDTELEEATDEVVADEIIEEQPAWMLIEIPEFPRAFTKVQTFKDRAAGEGTGRQFTASGPKADLVVKMTLFGGFTRQEMADTADCSVSRVAEVIWTMEAAGLDTSKVLKSRKAKAKAVKTEAELADTVAALEAALAAAKQAAAEKAEADEAEQPSDELVSA